MSDRPSIAELYLAAHRSFVELAVTLTDAEWAATVPCCPGWTVRDVLSHVAGIPDDALHGRMEGVATPPWTAAQVERWRDASVGELLDRWAEQALPFAEVLDQLGEGRPPVDCHSHEHDVRHALGRPGHRDSEIVRWAARSFRASAPLTIPAEVDDFEVFRSRIGRRSRSQVLAYAWPQPPTDAQLAGWFVFGPSEVDIVE